MDDEPKKKKGKGMQWYEVVTIVLVGLALLYGGLSGGSPH